MKKLLFIALLFLVGVGGFGQIIPDSTSSEVIEIYGDGGSRPRTVWYYKPTTYDSATSPILWVMHGIGGTGEDAIGWVKNIAENRKALIVAPNAWYSGMAWAYGQEAGVDTCGHTYAMYLTRVFKQMYRNVLQRENRDSIPVYFTGFSAGGQTVNRYMLVRQVEPDSIPIVMSMSVNPCCYVFCTDSINGNPLHYPNGLIPKYSIYSSCHDSIWPYDTLLAFEFCNDQIIQYYNENYGVLLGTADTLTQISYWGNNRYETGQAFYNFSDTNAVTRGTTLQWAYDTVSGVGHAGWAMYNTKLNVQDSSTIAETMLFDTPYHNVPQVAPVADFEADTTVVFLPNATVQFINKSSTATSYVWDFGDTTYSSAINPSHQYTYADTFTVRLKAYNGNGCVSKERKWYYIIVKDGVGIVEYSQSGLIIYPNPTTGKFTVQGTVTTIQVYDLFGRLLLRSIEPEIDMSRVPKGIYFVRVGEVVKKVILQ